ncbi:hypothetical protein Herbaro_20745 [Herbaspirillum sp. WKF16]|jgi:hypothetical protein|uniref:hypothetical protein n=1 Tax=Herbaspirillum sp. WKF16 TaxID=3028312 RepID=UPI0023A9439A|nr:hypothetical protein [Herbaspirillum sp. WKF16]WDZ95878.1 hypothetical protein Herbaro_20745 [Herbaspirillum sp. WKF16]
MSDTNRADLRQLSSDLRKLHKLLIECQSRVFGAVGTPFDHLQLVTNHPDFAWLRMLSEFMVEVDERLDEEAAPTDQELGAFKATLEQLIGPAPASRPEFREKYLAALHDSPELTIQHGAVRLALGRLERRAA